MILNPPGLGSGGARLLPHWPCLKAVGTALTHRAIAPGRGRADRTRPHSDVPLYLVLTWDIGRTTSGHGLRLRWDDETGWAYARHGATTALTTMLRPITVLHRVFADPEDIAETAGHLICEGRLPIGEYGVEWDGAAQTRATIDAFRAVVEQGGLWTGAG